MAHSIKLVEKKWLSTEQISKCKLLWLASVREWVDPELAHDLSLKVVRGEKIPVDFSQFVTWEPGITHRNQPYIRN